MFVQLQFDQEARRAMILQIGHFKDNVIFCRFPSWFLFYEYLIYLNAVISKAIYDCVWNVRMIRYSCMFWVHRFYMLNVFLSQETIDQEGRRAMILQNGIYAVSLLFHGISWYF